MEEAEKFLNKMENLLRDGGGRGGGGYHHLLSYWVNVVLIFIDETLRDIV